MIEEPSPVHGVQSFQSHLLSVVISSVMGIPEQEDQVMGGGKFWRGSKAAPPGVKAMGKQGGGPPDKLPAWNAVLRVGPLPQIQGKILSGREGLFAVIAPQESRLTEQSEKLCLGQIGAYPEGLLIRSEQRGEGPAA